VCRRPAGHCVSAARPGGLLAARWLSSAEAEWAVALSEDAARRIHMVSPDSPLLRLGVESGGCSGFSYKFDIDDVVATDKDRCGFRATHAVCSPQRRRLRHILACAARAPSPPNNTYRTSRIFERDGARLVVDKLSLEYVKGATVDFTVEMIGETFEVRQRSRSVQVHFLDPSLHRCRRLQESSHSHVQMAALAQVKNNPNSDGECGCGVSFTPT
jgi:Fe-S cluster assembly iron-binding protein IscA